MPQIQTRYPQSHLAACMIPWTPDFKLDEPAFRRHVQATLEAGYRCVYLMGTAGEGYALSHRQFEQVVELFAKLTVKEGLDPQVGVIGTSMGQSLERIGMAYDQGIRMFQISLPSWGALDEAEAMLFFETVCGAYPEARFLHYNLPRAGRIITGREYRRITQRVPNLVATKNSSTDYARTLDLMTHAPELQHFLLEGNYAMGSTMGECSLLCSFGFLFPKLSWEFFTAGKEGNLDEAFRITRFFVEVVPTLFGHCRRTMIDGAYDKTFVWLRDPAFSNRLLPPYLGLSEEESKVCREAFERAYGDVE